MSNAFLVKNKYTEAQFATEKPEQMKQWMDAIEKIRTLPRRKKEESDDEGDRTPSKRKVIQQTLKEQERPTKLSFEVRGIGLKFQDVNCNDWLGVEIEGLRANVKQLQTCVDVELRLKGLHVYDSLQDYLNPEMRYILTSHDQSLLVS
jgi:hypothetical protein